MKKEQMVIFQKKCLFLLIVFVFLSISGFSHAEIDEEDIFLKCKEAYFNNDFQTTIYLGEHAIKRYPKVVSYYIMVGESHRQLANYNKAEHFLEIGKNLTKNKDELFVIYFNLGKAYFLHANLVRQEANNNINNQVKELSHKAIQSFNKAISLCDDDETKANLYINLGLAYSVIKKNDTAIQIFVKANDLANKTGSYINKLSSLTNIGLRYLESKKYNEALKYFENVIALAKSMDELTGQALGYEFLGDTYSEIRDFKRAKENYLIAYKLHIAAKANNKAKEILEVKIPSLERNIN